MRKYLEPEINKIGHKRIGPRWVIIALAIICCSENIVGLLVQHKIIPVIPPKSNSIDHGTKNPLDLIV